MDEGKQQPQQSACWSFDLAAIFQLFSCVQSFVYKVYASIFPPMNYFILSETFQF